jgi:hypothetical protein
MNEKGLAERPKSYQTPAVDARAEAYMDPHSDVRKV